ncbi:MAG: hypothetical protein HKN79_00010 [Flavobacteriales bacterium]|nr:hypothetical protein [Flavobacteriales bacterium]
MRSSDRHWIRPTENHSHKQNYMIKYSVYLILFLSVIAANGQDIATAFEEVKRQDDVEGFVWKDEQKYEDFALDKLDIFPEDDAIILKKNVFLTTQKIGKKLRYWFMDRDVIYIRNKEAIEEYSTIRLNNRDVKDKFSDHAVRVFKQNGEIIHLHKSDYIEDGDELKVVVPNLEEGDIVDQYSFVRDEAFFYVFRILADDEIYFADRYPVLDHYCEFILKNGSFFKFIPLNDAPEVQIQKTGLPYGVKARVIIHDQDRPAYDVDERWFFPFKEFPVVRYALAVGNGMYADFQANFFDNQQFAVTETTDRMVRELLKRRVRSAHSTAGIKKKYIKQIKKNIAEKGLVSDREKVMEFYKQLLYTVHFDLSFYNYYNGTGYMMPYVAQYCREIGVDSRWLFVQPRFFGDREGLFLPNELFTVLQLDFEESTEYLQFVSMLYPYGYYTPYLEDSHAFSVPNMAGAETGGWPLNSIQTLTSDASRNRLDVEIDVTLDEDVLSGTLVHSQFGHESSGSTRSCDNSEHNCSTVQSFLSKQYLEKFKEGSSEYSIDEVTLLPNEGDIAAALEEYQEWIISTVDKEMKERFGEESVEEITEMQILNPGLAHPDTGFSYQTQVSFNDMVKKVGKNRLVQIGALVGGQVEMNQESRERQSDVYYGFARTYTNAIRFQIPEGFSAEGVEDLNMEVDNEYGGFQSIASIEDDILKMTTTKSYKTNHIPVEDWGLCLEFLDAAYDLSQKKILLKPIVESTSSPEESDDPDQ